MKNHCTWIFRPLWPFLTYPKQIKNQKTCKIDQKVVIFRGLGILHFLKKYRKFKSKLSHIIWIVPKNLWAKCYIAFTWKIFSSLNLKCQFWPLWLFFLLLFQTTQESFPNFDYEFKHPKGCNTYCKKIIKNNNSFILCEFCYKYLLRD